MFPSFEKFSLLKQYPSIQTDKTIYMITCSCCKSKNITHRTKYSSDFTVKNGMIKQDILLQYHYCNECGVMFHPPYGYSDISITLSAPVEEDKQ